VKSFEVGSVDGGDGKQRVVGVRRAGEPVGIWNPETAAGQLHVRMLGDAADVDDCHELVALNPSVTLVVLHALQKVGGQVLSQPLAICCHVFAAFKLFQKRSRDQLLYSVSVEMYLSLTRPIHPTNPYLSSHFITYSLLKCPIVKWFCGLRTRISFRLAK